MSKTFRIIASALLVTGCGASDTDSPDGPPMFGGGARGGTASQNPGSGIGAGQGGAQGTTPLGMGASGSVSEGSGNGGPLMPGNGGAANNAGSGNVNSGGANSAAGNAGSGAAANTTGGSGGTDLGNGGTANMPPDPGDDFVSVPVNGGASAAFICPDGPFGSPLTGMSGVTTVSAPSTSFFAFIEGPIWVGSVNRLFFSDNASQPAERIWQLAPPFTTPSIFMEGSGSNGLAVDNDDRLLLADQRGRRVTRVNQMTAQLIGDVLPNGNYTPNDLVMRSDDNLYFTDPQSGGRGFYRASPDGELSGPFTQNNAPNGPNAPNGLVLSPDERTLYVGDVQQNFVASFDLETDGAVDTQSGELFVRARGSTVDGMAVDCAGNLYIGTQQGVEIWSPDKTFIGMAMSGEASNATFGGADRRTLFVTSRSVVKYVTLGVPGLPD